MADDLKTPWMGVFWAVVRVVDLGVVDGPSLSNLICAFGHACSA
jgi:hypothetical protein